MPVGPRGRRQSGHSGWAASEHWAHLQCRSLPARRACTCRATHASQKAWPHSNLTKAPSPRAADALKQMAHSSVPSCGLGSGETLASSSRAAAAVVIGCRLASSSSSVELPGLLCERPCRFPAESAALAVSVGLLRHLGLLRRPTHLQPLLVRAERRQAAKRPPQLRTTPRSQFVHGPRGHGAPSAMRAA